MARPVAIPLPEAADGTVVVRRRVRAWPSRARLFRPPRDIA